jgi:tRNA-specific 2-thiouridylase
MKTQKVLVLLSGGLDSSLAVKIMQQHGFIVEAVNFSTPFCLCDKCAIESFATSTGLKIHRINLSTEFLELVQNPPHGYGSQMNPCIDCRILMLRHAKILAEQIGALSIVTGEVLNQRPFSQRRDILKLIERSAGLEGQILRPLSGQLLPASKLEQAGLIQHDALLAIQGRHRQPQIQLAEKMGIKDYPCPAGGCLLTDPHFTIRLKDLLHFEKNLTLKSIALIKVGRHFRVNGHKIIVGRNKHENNFLCRVAQHENRPYLEVSHYMGPTTLLENNHDEDMTHIAASLTVRYSDAPPQVHVEVKYTGRTVRTLTAQALEMKKVEQIRVQ